MRSPAHRRALVKEAHAGFASRPGSPKARHARAQLAHALWSRTGTRKLPGAAELDRALGNVTPLDLEWLCELSPLAPLYLLPTRRFVQALARFIRELGVRRVLEVGAGDGFLAQALGRAAPELEVIATDSGAWERPEARMSVREQRRLARTTVPGLKLGAHVLRLNSKQAIARYAPELVLASWLVPGPLLDSLIKSRVRYVLEIGAGSGVTGSAYSWRFAHEFCEDSLDLHARCRLDSDPRCTLHSRCTLYFGKLHPDYHEEKVRPGDFLWQFRPGK